MKRIVSAFTLVVFLLGASSFIFAGGAEERQFVRIATAGTGGNMYRIGAGMASVWNDHIEGVTFSTQSTDGSPHNAELIATGQVEVAFSGGEIAEQAYHGLGPFADMEEGYYDDIRYFAYIYPNIQMHLVHPSMADEINDIYDLERVGAVVSKGLTGSQGEAFFYHVVEQLGIDTSGMTLEDTVHGEAIDQMRDGIIDSAYWLDGYGSPSHFEMLEFGAVPKSFHPDAIEAMTTGDFHSNEPFTLRAGSYPNQPEDIQTVMSPVIMTINANVDEELAYEMVKVMYENQEALSAIAGLITDTLTLEDAGSGLLVPPHPGVERFYEENNVELEMSLHPDLQ